MNSNLNERSAGIDFLRCFSVLLVIASHYGLIVGLPLAGTHGVAIFFMVSGFCMSYSISGRNGKQFLIARFWRLIPILIVCATITELIEVIFPEIRPDRGQSFSNYIQNLLCLPTGNIACDALYGLLKGHAANYNWVDGAYWSLLVEIRFYILLWFFYYISKLSLPTIIIFVATLGLLSPFQWDSIYISKSNDFLMYLPFFAFGMSSSIYFQSKKNASLLMIYSLGVFVFISSIGVASISMSLNQNNILSYASCFAIYFSCMMFYRKGKNSFLSYIGIISYPLYLLHQDIGYILIATRDRMSLEIMASLTVLVIFILSAFVNAITQKYQTMIRSWLFKPV
ncbi:acyltransferase family protein [Methylophilus methylotrophus]|uniref:acyltransferase family protein n=1 Tax=Methylophilus methylotrophus TaxID=17 RepID=UPI0013DD8B4F|nr:acyltransferase [Methylophilus methylotrophus]